MYFFIGNNSNLVVFIENIIFLQNIFQKKSQMQFCLYCKTFTKRVFFMNFISTVFIIFKRMWKNKEYDAGWKVSSLQRAIVSTDRRVMALFIILFIAA